MIALLGPTHPPPGRVLILQWLIHLGMATSVTTSATSRRQQQQEGTSTRSRPTITGRSISSADLVDYTPLGFEVTGGFSKKVCSLLSHLLESEEAAKASLAATEWSWSAMGLPAYFQQAISFEIVRITAMSVQNGIRHAQAAASWEGLQPLLVEMLRQPQLLHACFLYPELNFPQLFGMSGLPEVGVLLSRTWAFVGVCAVGAQVTTV